MHLTRRLSIFSIVLVTVVYLFAFHQYKIWRGGIIGGGDQWGYYLYLPATFIHHDLDNLKTSLQARMKYHSANLNTEKNPLGVEETHPGWDGRQINKYTMGVAIVYSPFFFLAHFLALLLGYPADGYSPIYIYLIHLSSIFYTVLGLVVLRKVLLRYFTDLITAITLLAIGIGTNLYVFSILNGPMSHAYLFCFYAILLYLTIRFYEAPTWLKAAGVGLAAGFITLIRPTEIICLAIPVFYGLTSIQNLKDRLTFIQKNIGLVLVAVICFCLAGLPQLLYWHWLTGRFLHYSYADESFDFKNPHIIAGLFGYRNGWLSYTPIMYFALLGIICMFFRKRREFLLPILVFLPIHIYVIYSWWCWYYINGFGSRPMVETYALLSIPFACCVQLAFSKRIFGLVTALIFAFLIWLNLFNSHQFAIGILWSEDANGQFYKRIFGKTKLDYMDLVQYDLNIKQPEEQDMQRIKVLHENGFEDSVSANYLTGQGYKSNRAFLLNREKEFGPEFRKTLGELGLKPGDWLKISLDCMNQKQGYNIYQMARLVSVIENGPDLVAWNGIRLENKIGNPGNSLWGGENNIWGTAYFWVKIPENAQPEFIFKTYSWNPTPDILLIDNFKVEHYREK